jgi:hypothetical protein
MKRKGPGKGTSAGFLLLAASLSALAVTATAGAAGRRGDGPAASQSRDQRVVPDASPGARALHSLLARLWASGFFKRNEAVERELLNNIYAFFDETSPRPPKGSKGLGCFAPGPDGTDTIFLRKELFARFEVTMDDVVIFPDACRRALPVLVHEICHDLWTHILDDAERASFCREGVDFMEEYRRAQTPEDRRLFLVRAGDDLADPGTLRSYAGMDEILNTLPPGALRGHELFAWLAERLFMTKSRIPKMLGKYYSSILAEAGSGPREP